MYKESIISANMIVIFNLIYFLGKYVYRKYGYRWWKDINNDEKNLFEPLNISTEMRNMIDAEATEEYKQDIGIKFFPPAYVQRYVTVSDILMEQKYHGKIRKIVDFGCAELSFLVYLKHIPDVEQILCVDIDRSVLEANIAKAMPLVSEYLHCRTRPLVVEVCEGSAVDFDKKLEKTDAVVCIELIEHLYPETLNGLTLNIFGRIKPKVTVITTPNADFNVLFQSSGFRHPDHKFEWTRQQFQNWANDLVVRYPRYKVTFGDICNGPKGTEHLGACTQMAIFELQAEEEIPMSGIDGLFKTVVLHEYPFRVDNRSDEEKILDEVVWYIRQIAYGDNDMLDEVPLKKLMEVLQKFHITIDALRTILEVAGWSIVDHESGPSVTVPQPSTFSGSDIQDGDDWANESVQSLNNSIRSPESERFLDEWYNENWEEEPSIIIPQNNTITREHTYLYDGENISCVIENAVGNMETSNHTNILYLDENNYSHTVPIQHLSHNMEYVGTRELQDIFQPGDTLDFPGQDVGSIKSCTNRFEQVKEEIDLNVTSNSSVQADTPSKITQPVSRMLDFQRYLSTSHSSTSPEPYLLHLIQSEKFFQGNIINNEEECFNQYILHNTFYQYDLSKDGNITTEETDQQNISPTQRVIINDNITDICDNKDSVSSHLTHDTNPEQVPENTRSCYQNKTTPTVSNCLKYIEQNKNIKAEAKLDQKQSDGSMPSVIATDYTLDIQPQFTSSPKVSTKTNAAQIKQKSSECNKEKINVITLVQPCELHCNAEINIPNQFSQKNSETCLKDKDSSTVLVKPPIADDNKNKLSETEDTLIHHKKVSSSIVKSGIFDNTTDSRNFIKESHAKTLEINNIETFHTYQTVLENHEQVSNLCDNNKDKPVHKQNSIDDIESVAIVKHTLQDADESSTLTMHTDLKNISAIEDNISTKETPSSSKEVLSCRELTAEKKEQAEFVNSYNNDVNLISAIQKDHNITSISSFPTNAVVHTKAIEDVIELEKTQNVDSTDFETHVKKNTSLNRKPVNLYISQEDIQTVSNNESRAKQDYIDVLQMPENLQIINKLKSTLTESFHISSSSCPEEVTNANYPHSACTQNTTPENHLSSIHKDGKSPSMVIAVQLDDMKPVEVLNNDVPNNNEQDDNNSVMTIDRFEVEVDQAFLNELHDVKNENDIHVLENKS